MYSRNTLNKIRMMKVRMKALEIENKLHPKIDYDNLPLYRPIGFGGKIHFYAVLNPVTREYQEFSNEDVKNNGYWELFDCVPRAT
jgi:hypothetical protein